jgi:hypothetical protein
MPNILATGTTLDPVVKFCSRRVRRLNAAEIWLSEIVRGSG